MACLIWVKVKMGTRLDFMTINGGEGGTSTAPPEYSDSVGLPLEEGPVVVRNLLTGAVMQDRVHIVA